MSIRVYCDQCDKFMYRTHPAESIARRVRNYRLWENADFCSEACYQMYVWENILYRKAPEETRTAVPMTGTADGNQSQDS